MSPSTDRPELLPLVTTALDLSVDMLRHIGGPLPPSVLRAEGKSIEVNRFVAETLEEGLERAREYMRQCDGATTAVALVYDGYLNCSDVRTDAVFVAVQAVGSDHSDLYALTYRFTADGVEELGNAKHVGVDEPSLLGTPQRRRSVLGLRRR
jgi:hypothetical protein